MSNCEKLQQAGNLVQLVSEAETAAEVQQHGIEVIREDDTLGKTAQSTIGMQPETEIQQTTLQQTN